MATRIRTIKPEFFRHEELYEAEKETGLPLRIAFAGLFAVADREGRFKWRPNTIKLDVLPYDNVDFSRVLHALATRGFIVCYACPTRAPRVVHASSTRAPHVTDVSPTCELYGYIPSFTRHQVVNNREKASDLPSPDECQFIRPEDIDNLTRAPRVVHACPTPLFLDQAEGEGEKERETLKENKQTELVPPANANLKQPARGNSEAVFIKKFDEFFNSFINQVGGRPRALAAYRRAIHRGATHDQIMIAAKGYAKTWENPKKDKTFLKEAHNWLDQDLHLVAYPDIDCGQKGAILEPIVWSDVPAYKEIQDRLYNELGDALYRSWIAKLDFVSIDGGVITLQATRFIADWIKNHSYLSKIQLPDGVTDINIAIVKKPQKALEK
jgi:hypothetical protein